MSEHSTYDFGFGQVWDSVHVERRSAYSSSVSDYHKHSFYEINLILLGNVKILLKDRFEEGRENRIVLTRPGTAHFISCDPDTLYSRMYLVFTDEFIANAFPEWSKISAVFGKNGNIIALTDDETSFFQALIEQIEKEKSALSRRLRIYYFLLKLSELSPSPLEADAEPHVFNALTYIETHYAERINFSNLAKQLFVGRTTLMLDFKAYTGCTMGEYLTKCRLKNAIDLLLRKATVEEVAEKCGFADSSGFIRSFRRHYGTTPYRYVKNLR